MSLFLEELEQTAIQRIKKFAKIADAYKFDIAVGFSGGKDSQVVYDLCKRADVPFTAYYNVSFESPITKKFIKEYYREFSPQYYDRTWRLLNSVVKTKPKKIKDGYEVEVYIDTSIEYPSTWKGEPWTMENTMYMANKGQHGRFNGGYPHLWDEAYNDTYDSEEIIGQFRAFMQSKGINITIR